MYPQFSHATQGSPPLQHAGCFSILHVIVVVLPPATWNHDDRTCIYYGVNWPFNFFIHSSSFSEKALRNWLCPLCRYQKAAKVGAWLELVEFKIELRGEIMFRNTCLVGKDVTSKRWWLFIWKAHYTHWLYHNTRWCFICGLKSNDTAFNKNIKLAKWTWLTHLFVWF